MTHDPAELQRRARKLLPRNVYDYYAGGSGRERTLRANENAWRDVWITPRVLRDVSAVDTTTRLLGAEFVTPLCVAPTGYHGLAHPDGELATAAGAAAAGALFVLSTRSTKLIEEVGDVVAAAGGTWWFQVYLMRDRELTAGLVRRAAAAGAAALVLTADTPVLGRKRRNSAEVISDRDFLVNLGPLEDLTVATQAADLTFADIRWLGDAAGAGGRLPVVVKGVLHRDDARACRAHGAAGVIVSNHGGRQLDHAPSTIRALTPIVDAIGSDAEVILDGGVRRGSDVLKAVALGARACMIGRPLVYGLGAGGEAGARRAVAILEQELRTAMALAGCPTLADADRSLVSPRSSTTRVEEPAA